MALAFPAFARAAVSAPTAHVDTFVGTSGTPIGGPIDTFPGADVPFGMVQWSPDTPSQNAGGGYDYSDRAITGFSLTHLSGPGCSVFGDFGVLPTVGAIPLDPSAARAPFSHATEESAPGWYAVSLGAPKIRVELSVTRRTGIARFTFPSTTRANLLFNASSNQAGVTTSSIRVDAPDRISGSASSGFFCGMPDRYTVYFAARFNRPFDDFGTWNDVSTSFGSREARGPGTGAWVTFDATRDPRIVAAVGLSFVSVAGAKANLDAEERGWDPIAVRDRATETWNGMLGRVAVSGGTPAQLRTFYTALYHTLLHPNLVSDATGFYTGFDGRVHHARTGHDEYANYSDWDIYRTEAPLLALIAPGETSDMMQSLVDAARQENGWLPRWALVNGPTSVMGGDSVDAVIAGAYAFGARDFDARGALAAMVKGASTTAGAPGQRWYIPRWELDDAYLQRGYVINTHTTSVSPVPNGASETLEYAFDDFAIARLAYALHDTRTYAAFMRRSSNWMTLFDSTARSIEPRIGDWATSAFASAPITENGQGGFQEGNAAQYTWMVPQDLRSLIAAMGGASAADAKLDEFFSELNAGEDKPYAWLGNEPSLGTPWVYLSLGEPWRAQAVVRRALTTLYGDTPAGLPGNDDLGTMSAWYVWCAIGLYPQNPAVRFLDVGTPLFSSVLLRSPNGPTIAISSPYSSTENAYIGALRLNGVTARKPWVTLPNRGALRLDVTASERPNSQWGAAAGAAPPSYATTPLSLPPATAASFVTPANVRVSARDSAILDVGVSNRGGTSKAFVALIAHPPQGLHVEPGGLLQVAPGAVATAQLRIAADASLHAGYYAVRIEGLESNGAWLARLNATVRVDRFGERPRLAYAENRFGNTITPVDLASGATGPEIAVGEEPRDAVLSADGRRLYVANRGSSSISVVDTEVQRAIATVRVGSSPNGVALTPDGKSLWLANADEGTIESIDTATLKRAALIRVGSHPRAIAIAPNGSMLYVSNNGSNTVTPVDVRAHEAHAPIDVGERPAGLAITPDGRRLYVVDSASNDVASIDLAGPGGAARIPVGVYPMEIAISPNGKLAYVTNYANSTITPIDLYSNKARPPIEVGGAPYGVAFASDGGTALVIARRDNACVFVDVASGRAGRPILLGNGPYTVAAP
jgi:predicted alpha-1,2-mannosidase